LGLLPGRGIEEDHRIKNLALAITGKTTIDQPSVSSPKDA
jgi:hypothetical protein